MPFIEEGRLVPDRTIGEKQYLNHSIQYGEKQTITTVTAESQGREFVSAIQTRRVNPQFESAFTWNTSIEPNPLLPTQFVEVKYPINQHLSRALRFEEDRVGGESSETAELVYFPRDESSLYSCGVQYDDEGNMERISLEVGYTGPVKDYGVEVASSLSAFIYFVEGDSNLVTQALEGDGDMPPEGIEDGIYALDIKENSIPVVDGISWKFSKRLSGLIVEVTTKDAVFVLPFPKSMLPSDVRELLLQDKRLGGVSTNSQKEDLAA